MKQHAFLILMTVLGASPALAAPLTPEQKNRIDTVVTEILKSSGVPSATISIVTHGKLEYAKAFGDQRLDGSPPTITARYPVASISKQFTAATLLLLAEDGKLSLDDKVGKYLPSLTAADKITIRQLLSHTSGYRDNWPQDFAFSAMYRPITPQAILDRWAKIPLDFIPGTKWQYSNTGYVVAGLIAEMVAKEPLFAFEQRRIFRPLGMDVVEAETQRTPGDARSVTRFAMGPVRPARATAPGWGFAAGDLAMTPTELAKWNIARLNRTTLQPQSWQSQETNIAPADSGQNYGLGVSTAAVDGHRRIAHNGGWEGFLSTNRVYTDDMAAITVMINAGFSNSQDAISDGIERILFDKPDDAAAARGLFVMLRDGKFDRAQFTENGNYYFTPSLLADYSTSLAPLGEPKSITRSGAAGLRGGLTIERFIFSFADRKLLAVLRRERGTIGGRPLIFSETLAFTSLTGRKRLKYRTSA